MRPNGKGNIHRQTSCFQAQTTKGQVTPGNTLKSTENTTEGIKILFANKQTHAGLVSAARHDEMNTLVIW